MLMIDNEAPKRRQDLRPCEVDGDKAYFHGWITEDKVFFLTDSGFPYISNAYRASNRATKASENSLRMARTVYALIEYADGEVAKVDPESVRFVD